MKTANFNQKNKIYIPTCYFLSRHLGHLKPPRTFLTRHLFIDGHLLPSVYVSQVSGTKYMRFSYAKVILSMILDRFI